MIIGYTILRVMDQSLLVYFCVTSSLHSSLLGLCQITSWTLLSLTSSKVGRPFPRRTVQTAEDLKAHAKCVRIISHCGTVMCRLQTTLGLMLFYYFIQPSGCKSNSLLFGDELTPLYTTPYFIFTALD
ncbi:hypothetical protein AVEN_130764-1 [Araneus ventricosus]|uniref:Uncharacterized protein n=1 Tax=Araneus ventricosus TaxID=182803 RepID=A0A4Y2GK47_ARAVE|nr:hypothetical protein AVEN_130764-1 [Araneus ventricosus]